MKQKQKAFTLIELLVVIAIIGLLASIIMVALNNARSKARDAKRIADVKELMSAFELYYNDNNQYPASGGASNPNSGWSDSNDSSWNTLSSILVPNYLGSMPKDPLNNAGCWAADSGCYTYTFYSLDYGCNQQWYMIVYRLENPGMQASPGVTACDGTNFQYGAAGSGVITIGQSK